MSHGDKHIIANKIARRIVDRPIAVEHFLHKYKISYRLARQWLNAIEEIGYSVEIINGQIIVREN